MPTGVCSTPGCGQSASLACPKCLQLNLPASLFCTQECFKGYYKEHNKLHKLATPPSLLTQIPPEFENYRFTGPLRPTMKSPRRLIPDHIPKPDYAFSSIPHSEVEDRRTNKSIKEYNEEEIAGIRRACRIGREVLDIAGRAVRPGVTTDEIDRIVHEACIERGAYPSPLNYHSFPKSVCTSVNEVICHGIPDFRELQDGDIVNIDVSTYVDGYHGDLNETFLVGNVDETSLNVVETAFKCLASAAAMVRPGTLYRDLGDAISRVARSRGCSVVTTYCGHGIGNLFHTAPTIPHYANNKAKGVMKVGHIFTIEPMINLGSSRDILWPDRWTAVTTDGQRSAQFEHTFLVTETGYEILTAREDQPFEMAWDRAIFQR